MYTCSYRDFSSILQTTRPKEELPLTDDFMKEEDQEVEVVSEEDEMEQNKPQKPQIIHLVCAAVWSIF